MTTEEIYLNKKKEYLVKKVKAYNEMAVENKKINLDSENPYCSLCNKEICKKCKGYCCALKPKFFSPNDFYDISDLNYMREILNIGLISIFLNGEKWVIRPRGLLDKETIISYNPYYNSCCFYDYDKGCRLPMEYRPTECLLFINLKDRSTYPAYEKHIDLYSDKALYEYEIYQKYLQQLYEEYYNKKIDLNVSEDNINNLIRKMIK
ncbi:MAG: hypothetical protein E7158_03540 [Firmicutes bacterium]|nr:hypothetical protein [Bacillota bacterium]